MTNGLAETSEILLQDDFDRPDTPALGTPWTEENETMSEFTDPTGWKIGPGFIELNDGALTFHYTTHSQKPTFPYGTINGRPLAFAPLAQTISSFPAILSFTFTPHIDERLSHEIGFMYAEDGFLDTSGITRFIPLISLNVAIGRSSWRYINSTIIIYLPCNLPCKV